MRITKKVFNDLAIYMIAFGVFIGIMFPIFTLLIGVPEQYVNNFIFISSTIIAGILVAVVNIILARAIVGSRLKILSKKMQYVNKNIQNKDGIEHEDCLERCIIPVDSKDVIGESADSFNQLVKSFLQTLNSEASMREFTEIFTNELDLVTLSNKALSHMIEYTNSQAGLVLIDKGGEIAVISSHLVKEPHSVVDLEIVHKAFSTNQRITFDLNETIKVETGLLDFYPRSILIEPISYKNAVLGVILLASMVPLQQDVIKQLNIYTHGLSLGMHNAIIHEKLQNLAVLDPLTKVYNRRFGVERTKEEFDKSVRNGSPIGIMMLDIDFFKKVNDTYGHIVGDQVLINFSRLVKENLRKGDVLIRYGGEEFLAILPGATAEGLAFVGEKIRRIIAENYITHNKQEIKITVSIGAVSYPELSVDNVDDLIGESDNALYQAKDTGRNKVVILKVKSA